MYKLIIAGGRDFNDYKLLEHEVDKYLSSITDDEIVIISGRARGADRLGERYAEERGYKCELYFAEWWRFGKKAGFIRNNEMAQHGDGVITFWDGKSRGTGNMISLARKYNLDLQIIRY